LRASWKISDKMKISALCGNVFNESYAIRPALMDAPRNYTIRLDYKVMTTCRFLTLLLISVLVNACSGNQQNSPADKPQNGFVFSNQRPEAGNDFCRKLLPDAVVIRTQIRLIRTDASSCCRE
jgi:hypothetical protein